MMGRSSHGLVAILLVALAILIVPVATAGKSPPGSSTTSITTNIDYTSTTTATTITSTIGATASAPSTGVALGPTLASMTGPQSTDHAGVFLISSPASASNLHPLPPLGLTEEYDRALDVRSTSHLFSTTTAPAKMKGVMSNLNAARGHAYASWAALGNPRA